MQMDTANLFGATALAVADMVLAEAHRQAGVSASGAAALVVLSTSPGLSVTELGRRVGLSQSAAARMVDALEQRRLVTRQRDLGREVFVEPTAAGRRMARSLLEARGAGLAGLLDVLSPREQEQLAGLLAKVLAHAYRETRNADLLCRLCDRASCTRGAVCPVGQAERDG